MIYDYAIIGAGLTGALISYHLAEKNIPHVVIDKGRGVGGRFSTKRFENTYFNHGSQSFSFHEYESRKWFQQWIQNGWLQRRRSHWTIETKSSDLIKSLIDQKNVVLNEEVLEITEDSNFFNLTCLKNKKFFAKKIVLTAPLPQSVNLAAGWIPSEVKNQMLDVLYQKKIIFFIENKKLLRFSTSKDFSIESKSNSHMITFSDEISVELFDKEPAELIMLLIGKLDSYLDQLRPGQISVKKWRYAEPLNALKISYFQSEDKRIFIAGDAFSADIKTSTDKVVNSVYKLLMDSDLLR